ncbi:MAG: phosphatase PAP2 family protein, partial [Clostridia bacterium]|nr:phosphatase PAP2 family protein [Clostridia bacterium]
MNFDMQFLLYVQENIRNPILSDIFIPLTKSGDYGFIFIISGLILLCFSRTRKTGIIFLSA